MKLKSAVICSLQWRLISKLGFFIFVFSPFPEKFERWEANVEERGKELGREMRWAWNDAFYVGLFRATLWWNCPLFWALSFDFELGFVVMIKLSMSEWPCRWSSRLPGVDFVLVTNCFIGFERKSKFWIWWIWVGFKFISYRKDSVERIMVSVNWTTGLTLYLEIIHID